CFSLRSANVRVGSPSKSAILKSFCTISTLARWKSPCTRRLGALTTSDACACDPRDDPPARAKELLRREARRLKKRRTPRLELIESGGGTGADSLGPGHDLRRFGVGRLGRRVCRAL